MLIHKKTLDYLAELSRIELETPTPEKGRGPDRSVGKSEEKLLKDLQKILEHFEELKEVDTENIEPMAGGTIEKNVFREDNAENQKSNLKNQKLTDAFPEKKGGFLKVPPVFE
jgi:aspartyl-tRNA(Asn)/glutamyl-tRNA(Gln) amidotransferase subunit C